MSRVPLRRKHVEKLGEEDHASKRARTASYVQDVSQDASFEPFTEPSIDDSDSDSDSELSSLSSFSSVSSISSLSDLSSLDWLNDDTWMEPELRQIRRELDEIRAQERSERVRRMRQLILSSDDLREHPWVMGYYRRKVDFSRREFERVFGEVPDDEVFRDDDLMGDTVSEATANTEVG